ncbi:MAG: malonyl-ACP decarboxylase [Phenylobacterium sp.]|jgi:malonyl-ACP decarboxylase
MKSDDLSDIVITGMGITSAIGQGKSDFSRALLAGQHNFAVMQRPGRQFPLSTNIDADQHSPFLGAEIAALCIPDSIAKRVIRSASLSAQAALVTLNEAWHDANLDEVDPERIGLIIGGSNVQQRELTQTQANYQDRIQFLRPDYALSFMDSDLCGLCTQQFGIKGFAYTVGGASASGQMAILQAIAAVQSGQVDSCIAMGALMDLSYWECQGFRALGAMGSSRFAQQPAQACRPFDQARDGFIYGESCGVVVIEKAPARTRAKKPYARLTGMASGMDGNRNPNPSLEGEIKVIQAALQQAKLTSADIDYINPHGSGSVIGDKTELAALGHCQLNHAYINATKSLTGHGLSAAGIVEVIATVLQMNAGQLHPNRNLDEPMAADYNWVPSTALSHNINNALSLSFGFGGINTALCIQNISP